MLVDAAFVSRSAPASRLMLPSASLADITTEDPILSDAALLESFKVPSLESTTTSLDPDKDTLEVFVVSDWATTSTLPLFSLEVSMMPPCDCIEVEASESSLIAEALSCAEYWADASKSLPDNIDTDPVFLVLSA
jgi:hypothetical protein